MGAVGACEEINSLHSDLVHEKNQEVKDTILETE